MKNLVKPFWSIIGFLSLFSFALGAVPGSAVVPYRQLDKAEFNTNAFPFVTIRLKSSQFSITDTGGIEITNISGIYGGSTNISTNSIWGIDGFGNITPIVTNNAVIATNIVRYGVGRMFGTESWLSKALTLTNGPNYLGAAENSQFFLIGPTTNPADCQIILSNAVATGQKLVLVNQTNAIPSEGAWTMTNNTPIPDGAGVVKLLGGYDLISTNGYISYFEFISPDWQEVGRILASGASGLLTNVFNNIVVYSNITLRGNSTLTINNITLTTNDLWHTNVVGGVATNLQPVNLRLQPMIHLPLVVGTNAESFTTPTGGEALIAIRDVNKGESDGTTIILNTRNGASAVNGSAQLDAETFGANLYLTSATNGGSLLLQGSVLTNGISLTARDNVNAIDLFHLTPNVNPTTTPYYLNTDRTHTSGDIFDVANNGTNRFTFGLTGTGIIPEFEMHPMANALSSIRSTNGINFNIDGSSAFQWTLNGNSLVPGFNGSEIGSTTHPINGLHANVLVWGDGGGAPQGVQDSYGNGVPNGVLPASVGSVYRDTNGTPGAVLYVKETGTGNTGWTAIGAGGGGATLWYQYTSADVYGCGVIGTASTNSSYPDMLRFSNNCRTNVGGTYSGSFSVGAFTPDPAAIDGNHNTAIFNIGDHAGFNSTVTNTDGAVNIGLNAGSGSTWIHGDNLINIGELSGSGVVLTNTGIRNAINIGYLAGGNMVSSGSRDFYNIGNNAGFGLVSDDRDDDIYNIGDFAGYQIIATNSYDIYNIGDLVAENAIYFNSSSIHAFGNSSMNGANFNGSTAIMALNGGLQGATLTNSHNVITIGAGAGASLSGTHNNEIFIGNGSTSVSGSANQVILGTSMSLIAPGGLSSTASDAAVAITTTGITNNLGKLAFAYLQGTNLVFTIKDSSNTPYFTNSVAIGIQALPVQAGGAITISSGTASGVLKAL